jgi:hypothetical protein
MANSKRFVVKNGLETQNIQFVEENGTDSIVMTAVAGGVLSFSGTNGQLFSIVDTLTGSIFSVNDISGIASIEVFDDGRVILAESSGNVGIGVLTPTAKLQVKSDATTKVPLVLDTLTGQTANLAEFKVDGTSKLEVTKDGFINQNGTRLFSQPVDTSNTFFGNSSGGTSTTGTDNVGFGNSVFNSLTSGSSNTAIGATSMFSLTTGANNVSVGRRSGQTITSGSNNTFIGRDAGFNASQLATASNSTALGYLAYTDKSNQMVFGNSSVSEFVFNRNTASQLLAGQVFASSATFPPLSVERTTNATTGNLGTQVVQATTTANMEDGFGASFQFRIKDSANVDNNLARIGAVRSGADNSGRIVLETTNAGSFTEKMTIMPDGKVGIGTSAPASQLEVNTSTATSLSTSIRLSEVGTVASSAQQILFYNSQYSWEQGSISSLRDGSNNNFALTFNASSSGTNYERMRITHVGLVGINETSPSAQLQVKSGATNRIGLIVDALTGQTEALQRWRVNGSTVAIINASGRYYGPSVGNLTSTNNSHIELTNNGSVISRNIADTNPTLIVNQIHASSTGDILKVQASGTDRLTVKRDGKVGIGITSPTAKLEINDGAETIAYTQYDAVGSVASNILERDVLDFKLEGDLLQATQLLTNPDFDSGIAFWPWARSVNTASGGILTNTGDGSHPDPFTSQNFTFPSGNKIYNIVRARVTNANATQLNVEVPSYVVQLTPAQNVWYNLSAVTNASTGTIRIIHRYADAATANGKVMEVDFAYVFNITPLIANKQYSPLYNTTFDLMSDAEIKAQMDLWISQGILPNDNIQGVPFDKTITAVGKNLFNKEAPFGNAQYTVQEYLGFQTLSWIAGSGVQENIIYTNAFKPNTQYTFNYEIAVASGTAFLAVFYSDGTTSQAGTNSTSFVSRSITTTAGKTVIGFGGVWNSGQRVYVKLNTFQIEEGTTATTYEPYQATNLTLDLNTYGYRLPNGVRDSIEFRDGNYYHIKRVEEYTITGTENWLMLTSFNNIDYLYISRSFIPLFSPQSGSITGLPFYLEGYRSVDNILDLADYNGVISFNGGSNTSVWIGFTKGTSLSAAKAAITNKKLYYQLATPVETEVTPTGELLVQQGGTIYNTNNESGLTGLLSFDLQTETTENLFKISVNSDSGSNSKFRVNKDGDTYISGTLNIAGDIYQQGSIYETHAEQIYTTKDEIILRDGATTGLPLGEYAGLRAKLADGTSDSQLIFDGNGIARVGDVGDTQALATRQDTPVNGGVAYWNESEKRFDTVSGFTVSSGSLVDARVTNSATNVVPLIVNAISSTTENLQKWQLNGADKAFMLSNGSLFLPGIYSTSGSAFAGINTNSTGVVIARNQADANPALIVNLANAGSTANVQTWQAAGSDVAWINKFGSIFGALVASSTGANNSRVDLTINGTVIRRNVADANSALIVNQENTSSTGLILDAQSEGVSKASIDKEGVITSQAVTTNEIRIGSWTINEGSIGTLDFRF